MSDRLQEQIRTRLDAFAAELAELYRAAIMDAFGVGGAAPARRGRPRGSAGGAPARATTKRTSGRKGKRRSAEDIAATADKILKHVTANPGSGAEDIKSALGIPKNEWLRPIGMLVTAKKVRTTGQKRSTKYFPAGAPKAKKKAAKEE